MSETVDYDIAETASQPAQTAAAAAPPASKSSAFAQWWMVACLAVLMMLSAVDKQILALLMQPIKLDMRLTDTEVSLLMGLSYALVHTLTIIPSGWAADRWVRRWIVASGAVAWSVMTALSGLTVNYWQLFAARAGLGVTEGTIEPSAHSMVRDAVKPDRRGRAFGILAMAPLVGTGLAMIVGGVLLHLFAKDPLVLPVIGELKPWKSVLFVMGCLGAPMALLMLTVREPERIKPAAGADASASWGEAFRHVGAHLPLYGPVMIFALAHALISASFGAWLPTMLIRVFGMSPMQVGLTFGIAIMVAAPIGAFISGGAIDIARKIGRRSGLPLVGVVGTFLIGIPAVLAPLAPTALVFWPLFSIVLLNSAVPLPVTFTALASATPGRLMGKVAAMRIFLNGVCVAAVAPTLVALIGDHVFGGDAGGPRAIGYGISVVVGVSAVVALGACLLIWRDYVRRSDVDD